MDYQLVTPPKTQILNQLTTLPSKPQLIAKLAKIHPRLQFAFLCPPPPGILNQQKDGWIIFCFPMAAG